MDGEPIGLDSDTFRKIYNAPWYGRCGACGVGTMWYGDSEEAVTALVEEHVKTAHVAVWRNGGEAAPATSPPPA